MYRYCNLYYSTVVKFITVSCNKCCSYVYQSPEACGMVYLSCQFIEGESKIAETGWNRIVDWNVTFVTTVVILNCEKKKRWEVPGKLWECGKDVVSLQLLIDQFTTCILCCITSHQLNVFQCNLLLFNLQTQSLVKLFG